MTVEAATQTIRVTMKKYVLQSILDRAFSVASRASAAQVLQNVKMEVDGGYVTVIGSDAEITMVVRTQQVDIGGTGVALIPPKIHDIVKLCPDMEITLDLDPLNAQASITCGTAFWQVKIEQDEYPDIDARHEPIITVPKDILNRRIAQVRPAIQTENIRAMFQFVQVKDQKIRGTDGSRLHQADFPYAFEAQFPARAIAEIVRRLRGMALDDVEIGETERHYSFKFDDDLLIATKHTIEYPDVDRVMVAPTERLDADVYLDRKAVIDVVRRVAVTADGDTNFLTVTFGENTVRFSTLDKYGNTSREDLDIHWPHGPREIGLNHNYLADMLASMNEPQVRLLIASDPKFGASIALLEEGYLGVLVTLRQDLGDAAKGSDRVRPAQMDPVGWGFEGVTADEALRNGEVTRRGNRRRRPTGAAVEDVDPSTAVSDDVTADDLGALLDDQ